MCIYIYIYIYIYSTNLRITWDKFSNMLVIIIETVFSVRWGNFFIHYLDERHSSKDRIVLETLPELLRVPLNVLAYRKVPHYVRK
jgi:hypothetical protein